MSDPSHDALCKALDLADGAAAFYDQAQAACRSTLGRGVFGKVRDEKREQQSRIQAIHQGLEEGLFFHAACAMPEAATGDPKAAFVNALAQFNNDKACPASELEAINTALSMERTILAFYEDQAARANDATEKAFMDRMVQETKGHFILLSDMQYYYENPQGFKSSWEKGA